LLRLFLIKINPDKHQNDFNIKAFVNFYNRTTKLINSKIVRKIENYNISKEHVLSNIDLNKIWLHIKTHARPDCYDGLEIYLTIFTWLNDQTYESNYALWLLGFVILSYPIMPKLAEAIWKILGFDGIPSLHASRKVFSINKSLLYEFEQINVSEIKVG